VDGERRITAVATVFRGYDAEARTKKRRRAGGRQNVRTRTINPGVLDLELFSDFVIVSRVDDLVAAGLLPDVTAYNLDDDEFALFVSPQSTRAHGGYLSSRLSKKWGRLLHWLARDILRHKDDEKQEIPDWSEIQASKALRRKWRCIWNAHVLRQLIATYMMGVLKDVDIACRMTNDTPATLVAFYNQFDENMAELLKGPSCINHPEHFADVCRRLLRGEILDWASFDPEFPGAAKWVSAQQSLPARRRGRSKRAAFKATRP
jgi:hypothetical protein